MNKINMFMLSTFMRSMFMRSTLIPSTFILSTLLLPAVVLAEDTIIVERNRSQTDSYQATTSVTANRSPANIIDTPQNVTVVTHPVLEDYDVTNLGEALYFVSGITQSNTLGGTQDALIKRGFGNNRDGSILHDGIRSIQARNFTPTSERVEVLKGPSSMLYGMNEPGGLINVISKKPQLDPHVHLEANASSFKGGGGQLDVTGPLGESGFAGRLIIDHQETDYWRNFGRNRQTVVAPSLDWYGENTTVHLAWERMEYLVPFDRGTVIDPRTGKPVDTPRDRRFDESYNATRGDQDTVTFSINHDLNEFWSTQLNYAFSRNSYSDNQARATAFNAETGVLTRQSDATANAKSHSQAVQWVVNGDLDWGFTHHQLIFGIDYEARRVFRGDMIRGSKNNGFNVYDPIYGTLPPSTAVSAADSDQRENIDSRALFIQDSMRLNEHWLLLGGLRYDSFDVMAGKGRPFKKNTDSSDSRLVPRAGVVYNLNDWSSLYVSYTESFKPNVSIATAIDALPPEYGKSWEAGYKIDINNRVTGTLAVYDIHKRNIMVSELVDGETVTRTAGKARSRGLELDMAGKVTDSLSLIGSYAYTDARLTEDPDNNGNDLPNVARHTAALFLSRDFGSTSLISGDEVKAGIGARYVGKRAGDAANSFWLDNYTVADAFIAWKMPLSGYQLKWQLNVKNLFDKTYYPSSANNLRIAIGEPRQVVLQGSIDF